jgi:hypothetical protein
MKRYPRRDYGCDETRFAGIVVERRPQLADRGSQYRVGHELVAPNLIEQSVRGEQGPGCRTSAHRTANGVGASDTAVPSRSKRAFASSSSNRSKRTRTGFELAEDRAWSVRSAISILTGLLGTREQRVDYPRRQRRTLSRRHAGALAI